MDTTNWFKQSSDQALFEDVLWMRPENKRQAGSLLISGGSGQQFSLVQEAYGCAIRAGVGSVKLALPDALKPVIGPNPDTVFLPSSKTNAIAREAGPVLRRLSGEVDGVLIAGDVGRSAETVHAISALLISSTSQVTLTHDAIELFQHEPDTLLNRANTTLVLTFNQLQRLFNNGKHGALSSQMGQQTLIGMFQKLQLPATLVTLYSGSIYVAAGSQVSTTKLPEDRSSWQIETATTAAIFNLQLPQKHFEAITSSVFQIVQPK